MFPTLWRRWTSRLSQPSVSRLASRPRRRGFRPEVTSLEERCLLAVFTGTNFMGIANNVPGGEPPDTIAAAGPAQVVELINSAQSTSMDSPQIAFFDKTFGGDIFQKDFFTFFQPVNPGNSIFDPVVTYDELTGRFVMAALDVDGQNQRSFIDFAVSNNSDPTQGWAEMHRLEVTEFSTRFNSLLWGDYPKLGWNADSYVFTLNMYTFPTSSPFFDHVQIITIPKSSVLDFNRASLVARSVDLPADNFTFAAATMHGSQPGDPMWFVSEDRFALPSTEFIRQLEKKFQVDLPPDFRDTIRVVKMTNVLDNVPTFTQFTLSVPTYSNPEPPTQPDGIIFDPRIDTRMLNAALRGDRLVAAHNVGTGEGGNTLARWYEINVATGTPFLTQAADIARGFNVDTYYPSVEVGGDGSIGLVFMESSPREFMSVYVTGRTPGDPPNLVHTARLVKAGETDYQLGRAGGRAGDYSGISVDPTSPNTFWAASEYAAMSNTIANWSTWIANFIVIGTDANSVTNRSRDFLNQLYLDLLARPIDPQGLAFFLGEVAKGKSRSEIVIEIEQSVEYRGKVVQQLYRDVLGRTADPVGLNFFVAALGSRTPLERVKAMMLGSQEFFQNRGGGTNNGFLAALFNVALGRPIDSVAQMYYSRLLTGGISREQVAFTVVTSTEAEENLVRLLYEQLLRRQADSAGLAFFVPRLIKGAKANQPLVVSDGLGTQGILRVENLIAAMLGSEEYFRQV